VEAALSCTLRVLLVALPAAVFLGTGCQRQAPAPLREIVSLHMSVIYADAARSLTGEFERQTGIRVKVVSAPYLTLREKEITDLANGTGYYDVMQVAQQWDGEILPHLLALDELIAARGLNLEDFIPAVRRNSGEWNGKTHALPLACDVISLLYRTDVFAARAADYQRQTGRKLAPPATWDEYLEIVRFLNSETLHGNIIMGLKEQNYGIWSGILLGTGGSLVDEQWRPTLNSPAGVRSLERFIEMFRSAPPGSERLGIEDANALFLQGRGAMYLTWPTLIWAQMRDTNLCKISGKVAAAVIPGGRPQLSAWSLGINRACRDREAAFAWICFLVNEANTRRMLLDYGKGSPLASTYRDAECRSKLFYLDPVMQGLAGGVPRFRIPASQELCDYLETQISEAIAGRVTPQAALDRTAAKWRSILDETGHAKPGSRP
jgi:multiple sugar transport system substrate-binding protein